MAFDRRALSCRDGSCVILGDPPADSLSNTPIATPPPALPAPAAAPPLPPAAPSYANTPAGSSLVFYPRQLTADDVALIVNQQVQGQLDDMRQSLATAAAQRAQMRRGQTQLPAIPWEAATFFLLLLMALNGRS